MKRPADVAAVALRFLVAVMVAVSLTYCSVAIEYAKPLLKVLLTR